MKTRDFRYLERMRVRWVEVDMQRIVFNGHYLMYLDTALAGYWRALAMPYQDTMATLSGDLYVRKASLEYQGSARYDEALQVGLGCRKIGNSSVVFAGAIFRGEQCLVHGELIYVFANPATQTSQPVPTALRELLLGFEAGQPMLQVQLGNWAELGGQVRPLRDAVFVQEQHIAADLVVDELDASALHAVATNRLGAVVGSGRLVQQADGVCKVGRMATHGAVRGAGIGREVLQSLMQAARQRAAQAVVLHAQAPAVSFYQGLGFVAEGEEFEEAGVRHQRLRRVL